MFWKITFVFEAAVLCAIGGLLWYLQKHPSGSWDVDAPLFAATKMLGLFVMAVFAGFDLAAFIAQLVYKVYIKA